MSTISLNLLQEDLVVRVSEEKSILPTCGNGFDNPNTLFFETGGYLQDNTYPYAFHNHFLREKPVDKEYQLIVFENEFLRVEFAPELGGRIWRLYDKIHKEDAVHYNDAIKPYPGGFGGAYSAGGIELNYPLAHSVTNTWPRKTDYCKNPDGSATYTVSEWERIGRTLWEMSFTLAPGESRLKQKVTIYNRGKLPVSYVYWGNAGVPASQDTKWLYREKMGSEHGGDTIFDWPEFKGLDLSLFKNDLEVIGIYYLEPRYNFFGLTNLTTKAGLVHHANRHDLPGKKLWTWGDTQSGENRKWHLCLEPQKYGEVQSGRLENQEHLEWLKPEEYLTWDESWSPIHGLTDVHEVTADCAFQILPNERKLLCYPFVDIKDQKLQFIIDGKINKELDFSANTSKLSEIDLSNYTQEQISKLETKVIKNQEKTGSISLVSRCKRKSPKEIREDPIISDHSSMGYFVNAEFSDRLMYRKKALHQYQQAIELDELNYKAHTGLGMMFFRYGDFKNAEEKFLASIDVYKWDPEPYLMLSHIYQLQGKTEEAVENAFSARYYGERCRANLRVAELSILNKEYSSAIKYLDEALSNNTMSLRAYALKSLCQRKLGSADEVISTLDDSPDTSLRDLLWYSEKWFIGKITKSELEAELFHDEWRFLELGFVYTELGLFEEAEKLLDVGIDLHKDGWELDKLYNPERIWGFTRKRETPFLHMLKGYIASKAGRDEDAKKCFKLGDYFEYYINTNQPEMEAVLRMAIEYGNVSANHYLGNYLYRGFRCDEALCFWNAAEEKMECAQNTRNLAIYKQYVCSDVDSARKLLRKALKTNPDDLFLRQELIGFEKSCGASADDILDIYLAAPEEQKSMFLLTRGLLAAYMEANRWEDAEQYLSKLDRRHSDEDSGWYNFALGYADFLLDNGKPEEALEWLKKARPNPVNLSYVNYPDEFMVMHQEYYLSGLAYKMLGNIAEAEVYFKKAIEQPADLYFFKPIEGQINQLRFYVALAMNQLKMESAARCVLGGVNTYRETQALIPLKLEKSELKRWNESDPDSRVVVVKHAGPEI